MSKKLLLGLILCVGSQAINAAQQGQGQELALVNDQQDQGQELAVVGNQQPLAEAARDLAVRAGTEVAQQAVPLARRGLLFSVNQINGACDALAHRYRITGAASAIGASAIGFCTALVTIGITERLPLVSPLALMAGALAGTRVTTFVARGWNEIFGLGFRLTITDINKTVIYYNSDSIDFNHAIAIGTIYPTENQEKECAIQCYFRPALGAQHIENRICHNAEELRRILEELTTLRAQQ